MDRSWSSFSQGPPGLVYFNNSEQNFIPFNDSPQRRQHSSAFNPKNYSSPYKHQRQNKRSFDGRRSGNNRFFPGKGTNRCRNWNRSFCSPKRDNTYLIKAQYVHKSFLENPWEQLERQLEEKKRSESKIGPEVEGVELIPNRDQKRTIYMTD